MASVLLVDDDYDASEAVALYLRRGGHDVEHVANGRDALTAVLRELPDVVVLDLRMPEMDGLDFLQVIRSYLRFSSLPVVLSTAYLNAESERRARGLGVATIFEKHKSGPDELLRWIGENVAAGEKQPRSS
jgi:CheY-like chemotaxis protein